jgi:hypothetical protein
MNYLEIDPSADLAPGALKLLAAIEGAVQLKVTGIAPSNTTEMRVVRFTPSFLSSGLWVGRLDYCLRKDPHEPGTVRCAMLEGTSKGEGGWGTLDTVQHLLSTRAWRAPANPNVVIVDEAKLPKPVPGRSMTAIEVDGPGWGRIV